MKCEHCGKNEVTFVYRSNINGKTEEKHLCGDCAKELGYTGIFADRSRSMMQSFFGRSPAEDFFSPMPSLLGGMSRMESLFDDFFTEMPALRFSAPRQEQLAKQEELVSEEEKSRFTRLREQNALRLEMKKAVREENFERAAELRDQLRAMEGN